MSLTADIKKYLRASIIPDAPLARHTSLKVGGPVDLLVTPETAGELVMLSRLIAESDSMYFALGGGYNILASDAGYRGIIIKTERLNSYRVDGDMLHFDAGVRTIDAVRIAEAHGFAGLEFLTGIPGSMGGAATMNAGADGGMMADVVVHVNAVSSGITYTYSASELGFKYRCNSLPPNTLITSVAARLTTGTKEQIAERINASLNKRRGTQQVRFPNAGCWFKNPPTGKSAGQLIDEAGLKGIMVGGAQVSEVHANFLVNCGAATASDFSQLSQLVKERIFAGSGIELLEEVRRLGF